MLISEVVTLFFYCISIAFLPEFFGESSFNLHFLHSLLTSTNCHFTFL